MYYTFIALSNSDKVAAIKWNRVCFLCLYTGQLSGECLISASCNQVIDGGGNCGRSHHQLLHSAHVEGIIYHTRVNMVNSSKLGSSSNALLMISTVTSKGKNLITLWDSGANTTLITHSAAQKLGLNGKDIIFPI